MHLYDFTESTVEQLCRWSACDTGIREKLKAKIRRTITFPPCNTLLIMLYHTRCKATHPLHPILREMASRSFRQKPTCRIRQTWLKTNYLITILESAYWSYIQLDHGPQDVTSVPARQLIASGLECCYGIQLIDRGKSTRYLRRP